MNQFRENDVSQMREYGIDLAPRWKEILSEFSSEYRFSPDWRLLRKSEWWKTGKIGAVHCPGILIREDSETRAVLKVQGTRPETSEVDMINAFRIQNKSELIRPPLVYVYIPWSDKNQYEGIIMEEVGGKTALSTRPASEKELDRFFELYSEYRKNSRTKPWVEKPLSVSYKQKLESWLKAIEEQPEKGKLASDEDWEIVNKAVGIIDSKITIDALEFVHGHFDQSDLVTNEKGEVVLFSNLFWGWRNKFYDAVFAYHWWMLGMEHVEDLTETVLEKEREKWFGRLFSLPEIKESAVNKIHLNLALLERAVPALMVDRYLIDYDKPSAVIITEAARKELKRLVHEFDF